MSIRQHTLERISSLCGKAALSKIWTGAEYAARAYTYRGSSVADMELNSPQCVLLALLYSLVTEDIMSCCFLADACHCLEQLQSDYLKVWLAGDFEFPRQDMEKAMALLAKLIEASVLKLPSHVTRVMSSLAVKYRLNDTQLISPSVEGSLNLARRLEEAVANNSAGDIIAAACEGGDVDGSTQAGDSLIHLAVKLGHSSAIAALAFQKVNLEALNTSNESPLEVAIKNNRSSSVKVLLSAGAKVDKLFFRGDTYLHIAVARGLNGALELLLKTGIDVNQKNHLNETPMFQAVRAGNICGVEMLMERGANAEILPEGGKSLIEMAVESENIEMLKALLKEGTNLKTENGDTVFHLVAASGNYEIMKIIKGMSLPHNCRNHNGLTPLHVACDSSVVKSLIQMGFNVNDKTNKGETALYLASAKGSLQLVKALYQEGASVDTQDNENTSALMIAIKNFKEEVATFLLNYGANPKTKDNKGRTALHYAAEGGLAVLVGTLLEAGASAKEPNYKGDTPAFLAAVSNKIAVSNKTAVLRLLLENGADLVMMDSNGNGMLHREARDGHVEAVAALLDAGVEVDLRGNGQFTALHWAARGGHVAVMTVLLDRGADTSAITVAGDTPLLWASSNGHLEAVQLLVGRGAELNYRNKECTALKIAKNNGHRAVVDYLRSKGGVE